MRFLGEHLRLTSTSNDPKRGRTELVVDFDWPKVDESEDLGNSSVPYRLRAAGRLCARRYSARNFTFKSSSRRD